MHLPVRGHSSFLPPECPARKMKMRGPLLAQKDHPAHSSPSTQLARGRLLLSVIDFQASRSSDLGQNGYPLHAPSESCSNSAITTWRTRTFSERQSRDADIAHSHLWICVRSRIDRGFFSPITTAPPANGDQAANHHNQPRKKPRRAARHREIAADCKSCTSPKDRHRTRR